MSRVGSCSKGQTKGTMGSAAGLLGSLRLAAEPPAWEGRGKRLGWPQRARFPSAPTQALGAAGTPGRQRPEGRTASQAMVIARRAARCLRPAGTGLSGVRLWGSRLKQVPLRGKCCSRSQKTSPKCLGPCQSLVSSGCASPPWLAGTLVGGGCCSTSPLLGGRGRGEPGRMRRVKQGLDPPDPLSRPSVSLDNFSRGMQDPWCPGVMRGCVREVSRVPWCGNTGSSYPRVSQGKGGLIGALRLGAGDRESLDALQSPEEILLF